MYVEELKRTLNPGQAEIWLGTSSVHSAETCERYRRAWRAAARGEGKPRGKSERVSLTVESLPCPHRLEPTGEVVKCAKCPLIPSMQVHGCRVFAAGCVVENRPKSNDVQWCSTCRHRPLAHKGDLSLDQIERMGSSVTRVLESSGSDKHTKHGYGVLYEEILRTRRDARTVLELGVGGGASVRVWRDVLPNATVYAADVDETAAARVEGVATFVRLDVSDPTALDAFAAEHPSEFDLIVDDSSHEPEHQLLIRRHLWPALADGGAMVIEDIKDDGAYTALESLGGRGWDFRETSGQFDSRCVTYERRIVPEVTPTRRRPRVLFASHDMSLTGAPIILANLLPHLRGMDVAVYSSVDGPLEERFRERGVPRVASAEGFDLVVANTIASAPAVRAARETGTPCVWLIHESDPAMCGNEAEVRDLIGYPSRVVFPCQATAEAYRGMPDHRAEIVPTVIPPVPVLRRSRSRDGWCRVVTFGRDEPRKGQQDIREAVAGLDRHAFLSLHDRQYHLETLASADIYVCSSRVEAYPLSLQEAKAYGVPVITTPVFGCSEIIRDGVDGLHYQPGDVADLRDKIERIRTDPEIRARLSRPLTHLPSFDETVAAYEDVFREALGQPAVDQPIHVVYHVAGMGRWWKGIVTEQLAHLRAAGLRRVLATHVGVEPNWLIDEAARHGLDLVLCEHQPDVRNFEVPAMRLVERLVRHGDKPVLYLHSKGVSHPPGERHWHEWRRLMMRELVAGWRGHLRTLEDAVGVNWWTTPGKHHFSGNFWLASAAWLRGLPPFDSYFRDRYSCETWIGSAVGCRAKSLVCTDKKFWSDDREYLMSLG